MHSNHRLAEVWFEVTFHEMEIRMSSQWCFCVSFMTSPFNKVLRGVEVDAWRNALDNNVLILSR